MGGAEALSQPLLGNVAGEITVDTFSYFLRSSPSIWVQLFWLFEEMVDSINKRTSEKSALHCVSPLSGLILPQ